MSQLEFTEDTFPGDSFDVEYGEVVCVEDLDQFLGRDIWHKFVASCRLDWTDGGVQMYVGPLVVTTSDYNETPMNPSHADIAEDAELDPDQCFGGILCIDSKTGNIRIDDFFTATSVGVHLDSRAKQAYELTITASEEMGVTIV